MASEQHDPSAGKKREQRDAVQGILAKHVLQTLGRPAEFQRVQVKSLWGDCYRVNVLVGGDPASARIAHSYFLVADSAGNILTCNPHLTNAY